MSTIDALEAKIIRQIEYYFGDINLSRDKFMKQAITENDGWISYDVMLKFNRLKSLSEDVEVIKKALSKSSSGLLEVGPNGIRRNPAFAVPESVDDAFLACKDRCVYVKGFNSDTTLDEIIEWLEKHGGKTLNVHMRRLPKDKKFKGSVFAVFESKEDTEKFIAAPEAAVFGENSTIRMYREDYWNKKKSEQEARLEARAEKNAAAEAARDEQVSSRMSLGALLELVGLPKVKKETNAEKTEKSDEVTGSTDEKCENGAVEPQEKEEETAEEDSEPPTILNLKKWLVEKIGTELPIAWVDVEPAEGKAIIRFKQPNSAELAWAKLTKAFEGKPVIYSNCTLTGRVLSGDEEKAHWKTIFAAQMQKAQKRRSGRQPGRNFGNKRRRMN